MQYVAISIIVLMAAFVQRFTGALLTLGESSLLLEAGYWWLIVVAALYFAVGIWSMLTSQNNSEATE